MSSTSRANPIVERFRHRTENIESVYRILDDQGLIGSFERAHYEKPGQSIKYKISMLVRAIQANIAGLKHSNWLGNRDLRFVGAIVEEEMALMSLLVTQGTLESLFDAAGLEYGAPLEVERLDTNISYASIVRPSSMSTPSWFVRYSALVSPVYVNRYQPAEVVYQQVMAETVLGGLAGGEFTVQTIYPSIDVARAQRTAPQPRDQFLTLLQRILIQPNYAADAQTLAQLNDAGLVAHLFGRVVGRIQSATWGQNVDPRSVVKAYFSDFRDRTVEEYEDWLRNRNWIPRMYHALKAEVGSSDDSVGHAVRSFDGEFDGLWDRCMDLSLTFWARGAVLVPPDLNPRNTFLSSDGNLRVFDFDNLMFLDPAYHTGRCIYILLRTVESMGVWEDVDLREVLTRFRASHAATLEEFGESAFEHDVSLSNTANAYAAFNYVVYYLMSAGALNLSHSQIATVVTIGQTLLSGEH